MATEPAQLSATEGGERPAVDQPAVEPEPGAEDADGTPALPAGHGRPRIGQSVIEPDYASDDDPQNGQTGADGKLHLTLREAVRTAVGNNFAVKAADVGRNLGLRNWIIEKSAYDPFFTLSADYSKNRAPTSSFLDIGVGGLQPVISVNPFVTNAYSGGVGGRTYIGTEYFMSIGQTGFDRPLAEGSLFGINPQSQLDATIQITQPLLKTAWYEYNTARIRIAANNRLSAERQMELTATELVYQTESAYWQLSYALKDYEAQEQLLQTASENVEKTREERQAGAEAEIDVIVAESQLALRKVEFNAAKTLVDNTRDQLLLLMNRSGTRSLKKRWESGLDGTDFGEIDVLPTSAPTSTAFVADRDNAIRLAFEHRADYQQLQIEVDNKKIQVEAARNETLPDLDLTASWTQHGLDEHVDGTLDSLDSGQFYSWAVGVELRFPLSNRGPRNNYLRVKDELMQLRYQEAQLENEIIAAVDQSVRNLQTLYQGIQDLDERARLQQDLLAKEYEKLELGRSTSYNISVIENDVVESQAQSLRAKADYQTALADYLRVTGVLLRRRGIEIAPR